MCFIGASSGHASTAMPIAPLSSVLLELTPPCKCLVPGEGLGRNRQGISAPLVMQKTNARAGVIVEGAPAPSPQAPPATSPASRCGPCMVNAPLHLCCDYLVMQLLALPSILFIHFLLFLLRESILHIFFMN